MKKKIIICTHTICAIGGIETWIYNLTTALRDEFDFLVLYKVADSKQLQRLKVPYEKYNGSKLHNCDILLYLLGPKPTSIYAKHTIHVIHANYDELSDYKYDEWNKTDGFVFVSQKAKDHFTGSLSKPYAILENPVAIDRVSRKTEQNRKTFLCASRFTLEKGAPRLIKFFRNYYLYDQNYILNIYSTWSFRRFYESFGSIPPNVMFHEPKLDLRQEMADSDYVLQLSDTESFCYTIREGLIQGTPAIVTDWDGAREVVEDGVNGFVINKDLSDVPYNKIFDGLPRVTYNPVSSIDKWKDYLNSLSCI